MPDIAVFYGDAMRYGKDWPQRRKQRLEIDGYRCVVCKRGADEIRLEVHHLTYARLGNEDVQHDLMTVCAECHATHFTDQNRWERFQKRLPPSPDKLIAIQARRQEHGMAERIIPIHIIGPVVDAQRPDRRPVEQVRETLETSIIEARKDRRGL